jgi:hypothetical protein
MDNRKAYDLPFSVRVLMAIVAIVAALWVVHHFHP